MPKRLILHTLCLTLVVGAVGLNDAAQAEPSCSSWFFTGYARSDFPGRTADGTPTSTREPIAAAVSLPLGSYVYVPEWDTSFRIADRGYLGPKHLDVLVDTRAEAFALTGWRDACPL